jgi:hypothetical protein
VVPWACLPGRCLGLLHRVLQRIWPYLGKSNLKKAGKKRLKRGTLEIAECGLRYRASKSRNARVSFWHILTYPFWIGLPLVPAAGTIVPYSYYLYRYGGTAAQMYHIHTIYGCTTSSTTAVVHTKFSIRILDLLTVPTTGRK